MADETQNEGTETPEGEAQQAAGTTPPVDEVTTLRSRNSGLDAKVTILQQQIAAEKAAREAAEAKAQEYISGKANEDEDTRALIQRLNAQLTEAQRTANANALARKYPESFATFGEAIAGMSEDVLAAGEARLLGVPVESNTPPTPVANNAGRTPAPATKDTSEMSLAELKEYAKTAYATLTWEQITQS